MQDSGDANVDSLHPLSEMRERIAQLEAALRNAQEKLEDSVRQRTAELAKINERLRTEIQEHRQTAEQLQAIYDGMVDGLLIAKISTRQFVRANASISRMLGYTPDELLSLSVDDIHPVDAIPAALEKFHALAENRLKVADSVPVLRKDGSVFYADITTNRIQYNGESCMIGFFRDVTEREKIHEAVQREHQVLRQLVASQDRERQLIAYEIHDGLAQHLAGAIMQFETLHESKSRTPEQISRYCSAGLDILRQSLAEARWLISGLRPPILDESGIVAAINDLVHDITDRGGPDVEVQIRLQFDRLDPVLENAIFRITQESLTNAYRYSRSEKVRIDLRQEGERIRIEITDWGVGFDLSATCANRFGLDGIRERARILGGQAEIHSTIGEGTRIVAELPIVITQ